MLAPSSFMATTARRYREKKAVMEMARAGSDFPVNLFFPLPLTEESSFSCLVFHFGGGGGFLSWGLSLDVLIVCVVTQFRCVPALPILTISLISFHRRVLNKETDSGLILG